MKINRSIVFLSRVKGTGRTTGSQRGWTAQTPKGVGCGSTRRPLRVGGEMGVIVKVTLVRTLEIGTPMGTDTVVTRGPTRDIGERREKKKEGKEDDSKDFRSVVVLVDIKGDGRNFQGKWKNKIFFGSRDDSWYEGNVEKVLCRPKSGLGRILTQTSVHPQPRPKVTVKEEEVL